MICSFLRWRGSILPGPCLSQRTSSEGGEVETFLGLRALGVGPKKAIVNNAELATDRNGKKEEAWNRLK